MPDALPSNIQLAVVTPDRQVVDEAVESVTIPGKRGYLGILPGHAPLLSELTIGDLDYVAKGAHYHLAVCWGFAEVLPGRVIVLAHTAERAEEIDVARAERARQRAEERLKKLSDPNVDFDRARVALERALSRIQIAGRPRGLG